MLSYFCVQLYSEKSLANYKYKLVFSAQQHKLKIVIYNKIIKYILFVRLQYDCNILLLTETLLEEKI